MATYAWKSICPHEALVYYSTSTSVDANTVTLKLRLPEECPSCANCTPEQVWETLENTSLLKQIAKLVSECLDSPTSYGGTG